MGGGVAVDMHSPIATPLCGSWAERAAADRGLNRCSSRPLATPPLQPHVEGEREERQYPSLSYLENVYLEQSKHFFTRYMQCKRLGNLKTHYKRDRTRTFHDLFILCLIDIA